MALTWTVNIKWDGSSFVDEAARCIRMSTNRGRPRLLFRDVWADMRVGRLILTLDNYDGRFDPWNTSSALYPDVQKPNREVQVQVNDGTTTHAVFRGYTDNVEPYDYDEPKVRVVAEDGWRWLRDRESYQSVSTDVATGTAINNILTDVSYPWSTDLDTGADEIPFWWAYGNAADQVNEIANSEGGFVAVKANGDFLFKERLGDYGSAVADTLTQDEILRDIALRQPTDNVRNFIQTVVYPYATAANLSDVWTYSSTPFIRAGKSLTVYAETVDPATDYAAVTSTTDYTANTASDGSGTDLTSNFTVVETTTARRVKFVISNTGSLDGYLTLLKIRGKAITASTTTVFTEEDTTSQNTYGLRVFNQDYIWQQNTSNGRNKAEWLATWLVNPSAAPTIHVRDRPTIQFARELGDRINLDVTKVGLDSDYRIGGIQHQWMDENGEGVQTAFVLEPVDLEEEYGIWNTSVWNTAKWAPS